MWCIASIIKWHIFLFVHLTLEILLSEACRGRILHSVLKVNFLLTLCKSVTKFYAIIVKKIK